MPSISNPLVEVVHGAGRYEPPFAIHLGDQGDACACMVSQANPFGG